MPHIINNQFYVLCQSKVGSQSQGLNALELSPKGKFAVNLLSSIQIYGKIIETVKMMFDFYFEIKRFFEVGLEIINKLGVLFSCIA